MRKRIENVRIHEIFGRETCQPTNSPQPTNETAHECALRMNGQFQ